MDWKRVCVLWSMLLLAVVPATALDVDRKTVDVRFVEFPAVDVAELDLSSVSAEVTWDGFALREPELRTTQSVCVPKGSENPLKDAVSVPTHYYEVGYEAPGGVAVIRDGDGNVIASSRIPTLESSERFGYDRCEYVLPSSLDNDYAAGLVGFRRKVDAEIVEYFRRRTEAVLDAALFFNIVEETIPYYTFQDKRHDYADLDEAATLARTAYDRMREGLVGPDDVVRDKLGRAIELWAAALEESDPNDKAARINRKATARLHENIGTAHLMLGDAMLAQRHLEKAARMTGIYTTRSDGSGTTDLLERAEARGSRAIGNAMLHETTTDLAGLIRATNHWRNRVPIKVLAQDGLERLQAAHVAFAAKTMIDTAEVLREQRDEAVASGAVNPYEHLVQRTASQGFILFLTSYYGKLTEFPAEVCELSQLNRLRVQNHEFDTVPAAIANLTALEVLNLSGNGIREISGEIGGLTRLKKLDLSNNRLERLPDAIGGLSGLKSLQLKGNPLAAGEPERLRRLLPDCKIKL